MPPLVQMRQILGGAVARPGRSSRSRGLAYPEYPHRKPVGFSRMSGADQNRLEAHLAQMAPLWLTLQPGRLAPSLATVTGSPFVTFATRKGDTNCLL
jgi:hypothetical protein